MGRTSNRLGMETRSALSKAFVKLPAHLLHNHPHDSIWAVSIATRYIVKMTLVLSRAQQIVENVASSRYAPSRPSVTDTRATMHSKSYQPHKDAQPIPIVVFRSGAPRPRTEAVAIRAQVPWPLKPGSDCR